MTQQHPPSQPRRLALRLAAMLPLIVGQLPTTPAGAGQIALPDLGNSADAVMGTGAEARLGKVFMQQVRAALPVSDDFLLTAYLESLGNELVAADKSAHGSFEFFLIDEPIINAFAGPGGRIGVFSGLILASQSEDELAAVLAHEIAHVTQRHLMRGLEDQGRMAIPALAMMLAAAILGARVSGDLGAAALAGVQAASIQRQINFTRENEKEADRIGIATLAGAGRDPYAMAGFFGKLAKANPVTENSAPEFLRTHPVNTNRISDALGRAVEHGTRQRPDSLGYLLARTRLRERAYRRPEQSLEGFRASLRDGRFNSETAERYGYALALVRSDQWDAARAETTRLLVARPSQAEFIVLSAQIDQHQGRTQAALDHLGQAVSLSPGAWALRAAYAEALMGANQPRKAMEQLKAAALLHPGNPRLYDLLTQAATRAGDKAGTYRYRAERLYAEGDLEPAIKHLEFALRQPGIPYHEAAQMQVLLDGMKEEERDEKKRGDGGSRKGSEFSLDRQAGQAPGARP